MWEVASVPDRGCYLRCPVEGATATPWQYIGPMGDMVAPHKLLTPEQALAICNALNELEEPKMNLYLLTQRESTSYDTFDSCVVAAPDDESARLIRPYEDEWPKPGEYHSCVWASKPESVEVQLIGTAIAGTVAGVIVSSFNAG